jgi:23S rRNA (pseudouridine1915-N3)-methyltransferase
MTSIDFAKAVSKAKDNGRTMVFILGGAYGLTDAFKRAIPHHLRVSDMTLPHELCQVIFMEQLYRAIEIEKGSGYHH